MRLLLGRLTLLVLSSAFWLVLLDVWMRAGVGRCGLTPFRNSAIDALPHELVPGRTTLYKGVEVRINQAGFRGPELGEPEPEARVTINSRAGTIIISGDVEIGDDIVSHKNIVVETMAPTFGQIDVDESNKPKLDQLVNQLNSLRVPTADMIEIIQGIDRNGKLHGRLIIND